MKLNIEIGNYVVTGTSNDLVLSEKRLTEKDDGTIKETVARLGYYSRLDHLVKELCHREILNSEAQTLQGLVLHIDTLAKSIHKSVAEFTERQ